MSGNIIKFPNTKKRKLPLADVLVDRFTDSSNRANLGHITFTCVSCDEISSFNFTGVIFKTVTFYCINCGHGYKVTNPMFAEHKNTNSK